MYRSNNADERALALMPHPLVSDRELELITMIARGYTTELAARKLFLSKHTVGEQISILLGRFACKNRAELVAYCYVHGLLSTTTWPPGQEPTEPVGGIDDTEANSPQLD